MNKIGIDFGTTCKVAWINPFTGLPEAIPIVDSGSNLLPSVVHIEKDVVTVGEGGLYKSQHVVQNLLDKKTDTNSLTIFINKQEIIVGRFHHLPDSSQISQPEILIEILSKIYKNLEVTFSDLNTDYEAVITHPIFFNIEQKKIMHLAAQQAGFLKITLIPEVIAAVEFYRFSNNTLDTNYLVYNFGETSFEVSFILIDKNEKYTIPVGSEQETHCGGQDIDKIIYKCWNHLSKTEYKRPVSIENGEFDLGFLASCKKQKEILSIQNEYSFNEVLPAPGFRRLEWKTTRLEFEKLISPIIGKTFEKTKRIIKRIHHAGYKIDQILLIGGSSRIPAVSEELRKITMLVPKFIDHSENTISLGAALYELNNTYSFHNDSFHKEIKLEDIPEGGFCVKAGHRIGIPYDFCNNCRFYFYCDTYYFKPHFSKQNVMNKIGIDFGTTFSTASWINPKTKQPEAIVFHDIGVPKMPSVVYYGPDGAMVGLAAYNQLENSSGMKPEQRNQVIQSVVQSIKRDMKQGQYFYTPSGGKVSHEEIVAAILRKVKEQAEITCFNSQPVEEATITHPVVFAAWQKEMLRKAATLAGFKKVNLLEEPVAAALGYAATTTEKARNILVYDFGGGTFDVAYVQYDNENQYRVPVEPEGDFNCGGDDVDIALYDRWEQLAKQQHNRTIDINPNNLDISFRARCRKHKEQMSLFPKYTFSEVLPPPGFHRIEMELARPEYDRLVEPIIARTIAKTERLLRKVKEAGHTIDTAIMIGGSSRIPVVYDRLKQILPVEPRKVMQVDVAVALGAVIYNPNGKQIRNEQVFCIHCGFKQPNTNRFCIKCGKKNIGFVGN